MIANIDGKYYALDNRCGHSNAALSSGILNGNIVTCPLHAAEFDVTTGKKVKEPDLAGPSPETLPDNLKKYSEYSYGLLRDIKVHDQERYRLTVDNDSIKIGL